MGNQVEERSNHEECGDTRQRLYTRDVIGGRVSYCHNCGMSSFKRTNQSTPSDTLRKAEYIKAIKNPLGNAVIKNLRLPYDFTNQIPLIASTWIKKYGITDGEIELFGFGWSESLERLILPVYVDDQLMYWQGRTFKPISLTNPKYLNIRCAGAKHVYFQRKIAGHFGDGVAYGDSPTSSLVIVEDILSAVKCGRYISSLGLLGSYLPDSLSYVLNRFDKIYLWLDHDKLKTSAKALRRLAQTSGKILKIIDTSLDPKEISDTKIKELLCQPD